MRGTVDVNSNLPRSEERTRLGIRREGRQLGVRLVETRRGKIDVLVNNGGIGSAAVTEAFTAEQSKVVFDTNVIGLLRVIKTAFAAALVACALPVVPAKGDDSALITINASYAEMRKGKIQLTFDFVSRRCSKQPSCKFNVADMGIPLIQLNIGYRCYDPRTHQAGVTRTVHFPPNALASLTCT